MLMQVKNCGKFIYVKWHLINRWEHFRAPESWVCVCVVLDQGYFGRERRCIANSGKWQENVGKMSAGWRDGIMHFKQIPRLILSTFGYASRSSNRANVGAMAA